MPKNHSKAVLFIFLWVLIIGIFISPYPAKSYEYFQLCILFISLTAAYVATYPGIEVDSPSLVMVMEIFKAGADGLERHDIEQKMSNDILIIPRLKDLVKGKMAYLDGQIYKLTPRGIFLARFFTIYRKLLKIEKKGG